MKESKRRLLGGDCVVVVAISDDFHSDVAIEGVSEFEARVSSPDLFLTWLKVERGGGRDGMGVWGGCRWL